MKSYKARGVVLNTIKYGDKGVIVNMLTDTAGRQSYMVQGIRPTAKGSKMALLQPMFAVEFEGLSSSKMTM
ncbi:MAG: recombination protein O N-terminal domain-containing protein, partial [Alistipes sp.]|nr:recombination protein O N-terminal domain-containing protein [Alistipes sp.]